MWRFLWMLGLIAADAVVLADDWPRFRGPTGMGQTSERGLPTRWNADRNENVVWKASLPGASDQNRLDQNQSSPVVWGDAVLITTSFWPAGRPVHEFPEHHVARYRASDGRLMWDVQIEPGPWKLSDLRGGYTAPTPTVDGERVYVVFGSAVLAALDFDGRVVWRHEFPDFQAFDVAIAGSPVVDGKQVLVLCDKSQQKGVISAFDGKTGALHWQQKRPGVTFAHSTPVIATIHGKRQILVSASNALQGLNLADGSVAWWVNTPGDVCSPVLAADVIYSDSGRGGPGVIVEPGGAGDLTATHIKFRVAQIPEGLSSPVAVEHLLYRLHNPAVLKCFDLQTGAALYSTRLEGVSVASSPVATPEGRVYFGSAGKTYVVQAGPQFTLLETNDLGDPGPASMAVSGGRLFFKGKQFLFCIGSTP